MKAGWEHGELPQGITLGPDSIIKGPSAFKRFFGRLTIGKSCLMDGVQFSIAKSAQITIGDQCYFTSAILMSDLEIRIGNRVIIGWNSAIADSDFHPIDPALRIEDAIACSPAGKGKGRPPIEKKVVVIQDDVWIGPSSTILKGVTIGAGAFIEPGAIITRDVAADTRVGGNPAVVIGKI